MKKGVGIVLVLVLVAVALAFFFPSNSPTGLQTAELNEAPRFIGDSFQVNSSLSIDLRDYFVDPEGEALGFAVDDAQVSMQGFILTFTAPQAAGNYVVNVQVSDGTNTVYKPLTFNVQGETPTQEAQVVPVSNELRGELAPEPAPAREVQEPERQASISEIGISATCNSCASCDTCMDSTQTCQLTQSIASAADTTCITVSGASAVLDCQNFTITYNTVTTDTRGVTVQANGATIQNCLIQDAGSPGGEISSVPILVDTGVTGVTVNNNTLLAGGADERGVVISSTSSGVVVSNNSITANNVAVQDLGSSNIVDHNIFSESAIAVLGGGNAQIRNNRVQSSLVSLHFRISGQGARITNNTLFLTGTPGNTGMSFESFGSNATVENNTITMFPQGTIANNNAVRLSGVSNVTLRNNTINLHAVDGSNFGIQLSGGANFSTFDNNTINSSAQWINATAGTENNFTNTTFANQNGSIRVGNFTLVGAVTLNQSVLNISQNKSFVNSTTAPILNVSATVALRGVSFTNPKVVVDVEDDGTYVACAAPTCNESSYAGDVFVFDVGRFTSYAASEDNNHPSIAQVILNNSNGAGYNLNLSNTSSNLTVFVINATDADGDSVQNITDWRVNGSSIAALNMPFETNTSSTASGAVKDYSTFIRNGTLGGGTAANVPVWNSSGKIGAAYTFDGSNDYIRMSAVPISPQGNFSFAAWINASSVSTAPFIFSEGTTVDFFPFFGIQLLGNGSLILHTRNDASTEETSVSSSNNVTLAQWNHVAVKKNGSSVTFVVNGVSTVVTFNPSGTFNNLVHSSIGNLLRNANEGNFNGSMDEVAIFNRALSSTQINQLYSDGSAGKHLETIVSGELVAANNWTVAVTPNDNQNASDGTTVLSNGVVIQSVNNHPSVAQVILNSTDGSGESANASSSQEALTVVIINATDADNDSVQNITDFRIEGVSLAIVNLPFETNVTASLGVVRDYSTFGANGTLGNGTSGSEPLWNASGRVGGAYTFDGTHDIINVSGGNITYDMTIAAWIRTTSDANFKMVASNREATGDESGWEFYVDAAGSSGNVVLQVDNGPATGFREGTSNVRDGNWHHIVGVRNGSSFFVYVDGVVENGAHGPLSGSIASNATTLIGRTPSLNDNANRRFFGTLDEFIIFNRSLSQEQVRRLYLDQSSGYHLQTILPQEVRKGENWSVAVTPNDNENASDGSTVVSNTVTISNSAPTLAQAVLNSTDGSGSSANTSSPSENLTIIAVSASDAEGESIQNVTDWRVNGSSITILNMPFESNISTAGGIVRDYSSSNITGLPGGGFTNGTPSWNSSGRVGGAYTFDGRDDYIDVTGGVSTLEGRTRGSIEFWFKSNDTTTAGVPVFGLSDKDTINDFTLIYVGDTTGSFANESFFFSNRRTGVDRLAFGVTNGHAFYKDMAWHHFVLVTGNGDNAIYVDGVRALNVSFLTGTGATNELTDIDSADTARIGSVVTVTGNHAQGTIDEFRFYNRTLTAQQVAQLYADGLAGRHPTTLVSQEVGLGDVWSVAVTPNDLQPSTDGSTVISNSVTISADNTHPSIAQVILNNTNGAGYNLNLSNTTSNLTVFVINATDADSDSIQNITDWRLNGASIAVLNVPFETNASSTASGAIRDYSAFANNGTLGGGGASAVPTWTIAGKVGGAYVFDGSNDYVEFGNDADFNITGNITLEAWVNPTSTTGARKIISKWGDAVAQDSYILHLQDGRPSFAVSGPGDAENASFTVGVNTWAHIVGVYNGSAIVLYVNGTPIDTDSGSGPIATSTSTLKVGQLGFALAQFFAGTIDEPKVYSRALTADQVYQNFLDGNRSRHVGSVVSQELRVAQNWSVAVTPNDQRNASDGTTVLSNGVVIQFVNSHPSIAQVILNSTDGSGYTANTSSTSENLTVFVINASDADGDSIQNITDWRVNGSAFAAFNMPFETNVSVLTSGEVKDYSVNRYNGTLGGGISGRQPLWNASGKVGGAFTFTANDLIFVSDVPNIDGGSQQTLEAWVYPHNTPPDGGFYLTIMGTGDSSQPTWDTQQCRLLYMNPSGAETNKFYMDCGVNNANAVRDRRTAAEYAPGSWYHVVGVFNDGTINLYVNGVLDNGAGTTGSSSVNTNAYNRVWIGNQVRQDLSLFGDTVSMNGTVDEVKVYTRALSAAQIYRNYLDGNRSKHVETIVSGELSIGQNWSVAVTPNDQRNASDGTTVLSNGVVIQAENNHPSIAQVILNSTDGSGYTANTSSTSENLTVFVINATDADNDGIQNITDWRVNGTSVAVLNVPFETNTSTGTTRDYSTAENNMTLSGGPAWTSGIVGGAYSFDGVDDSITRTPEVTTAVQNVTLAVWVYPTVASQVGYLLYNGNGGANGYGLLMSNGACGSGNTIGVLIGGLSCDAVSSSTVINTNQWAHVAVVRTGTTWRLYVNGTQVHTGTTNPNTPSGSVVMGSGFTGKEDQAFISNQALSSTQIAQLYQDGLAGRHATTFVSAQLRRSDIWSVAVTPNDQRNASDGTTVISNSVTISNAHPSVAQVILNSSDGSGNTGNNATTSENLTTFIINATDADDDSIQNITDFRVNGTSLAVLNMPFETNTTSTTSGVIRDYSSAPDNGTLGGGTAANAPTWNSSGKVGGAYAFDGNDFINADAIGINNDNVPLTFAAWIYPAGLTGERTIISTGSGAAGGGANNNNFNAYVRQTDELGSGGISFSFGKAQVWAARIVTGSVLAANQWTHVTATYDGSRTFAGMKLYINGTLASTTNIGGFAAVANNYDDWVIGAERGTSIANSVFITGGIDEVAIYNKTLTAAQVYQLYSDNNRSKHLETIVSGTTGVSDVWSVAVTPNDQRNASDGTTVISNNVTILQESEVVKADSSDPVNIYSSLLNYTVTITATNDSFANISLVETYPAQVTYVSSQPSPSSGNNVFAIPNLSLGQSYIVNITVNVTPTTLNNTVINNTVNISYHSSTGANLSAGDTENTTIVSAFFADHCDISSSSFTLDHSLYCANITVNPGVTITLNHAAVSPVEIVVTEVFNLSSTATIQGTGAGFAGGLGTISCGNPGSGPGAGGNGCALPGGGAGHGGNGGSATSGGGGAYGSSFAPTTRGSGGGGAGDSGGSGGAGGGAVRISAGTAYIDGNVLVNGVDGFNGGGRPGGGGGSGGSISITANALAGSGSLQAKAGAGGGGGSAGPGGSGAGGRILVRFNTSTFNISQANVTGQAAQGGSSQAGEAGTLGFIESDASVLNISQGWRWESTDGHVSFVNVTVQNGTLDRAVGELVSVSDTYLADGVTMTGVSGTTEINATRYLHRQGAVSFLSGTRFALGYNSTFDDSSTTYAAGSRLTLRNISVSEAYFNPTAAQVFNLSANTRLANNSVRVLSSVIPGLNVSANLSLYNITQGDPFPIVDIADNGSFVPCTPPRCVELSFVNNVFVYSVTGFTSYSSDASVSLTKDDSPDPVTAGQTLSYTLFINNSNGNIENVTVIETYPSQVTFNGSQPIPTVGNNTFVIGNLSANGTFQINITVNVSGAVANGTVINNTANLTFNNASGSSFFVNVTEGTTVIAVNAHPSIAQVILNSTDGSGYLGNNATTSENLTVFIINATDADNDSIQNITDWRVNGTSIAVLNLPFETNVSLGTTGAVRDYSSFQNNGTSGNGTGTQPLWNSSGKAGGAFTFDGVDDIVEVNDSASLDLYSTITIAAWVYPAADNAGAPDVVSMIVNKEVPGGANAFEISRKNSVTCVTGSASAGTFLFFLSNLSGLPDDCSGWTSASASLPLNTWSHVALTYNGSNVSAYVDGALTRALPANGTLRQIEGPVKISGRGDPVPRAIWNGSIDEVLIFNHSLSGSQVAQLYQDGLAGRHMTTLVHNETATGNVWSVAVTPNDQRNASDGTTVLSNNVTILADDNNHPVIAQVILNSSDGSGFTANNASNSENLTVFIINASDADSDGIQNITDWRVNGTSVALMNFPFETNVSVVASGAVRDYSSFGYNATLGAGAASAVPVWNSSGRVGGAYTFDGSDDLIQVASPPLFGSTVSVELWIRRDAAFANGDGVTYGKSPDLPANYGWLLHPNAAGTVSFYINNGSAVPFAASTSVLAQGVWHHVVGTYDGSAVRIYVNGTLEGTGAASGAIQNAAGSTIDIGHDVRYVGTRYLTGSVDEVRIYNRTLTQSQIQRSYADGLAGLHATNLSHNETSVGDIWSVAVTPNDQRNASDGTTVLSNNVTILADDNNHPTIAQVILNSTDGSGSSGNNATTSENLTVFIINATDADNDGVQNITDWRLNGTSIALINLPFETNVTLNTSGAVRDYTTFVNNFTLGNGSGALSVPLYNSSGKVGAAYTFDGLRTGMSGPNVAALNAPSLLTVSAWVHPVNNLSSNNQHIVAKYVSATDDGWLFRLTSLATFDFDIRGASFELYRSAPGVAPLNTWTHLAAVYNSSASTKAQLYVNGQPVSATLLGGTTLLTSGTAPVTVGYLIDATNQQGFNGSIDEVLVINDSLSASQIAQLYQDGLAGLHMTTLVHNETATGDIWSVAATPNDQRNASDGTTVLSNNVTILADDVNQTEAATVKIDSPDPLNLTSTTLLNYSITFNLTNGSASNVTFNESYPANVSFVNATPSPTLGNFSWDAGNLTAPYVFNISVLINVSPYFANGTLLNNSVNVSFNNGTGSFIMQNATAQTTLLNEQVCPYSISTSTTLTQNVSCPATAFNILADNVVFDCAGYTVRYSTDFAGDGVNVSGINVTVKNCRIVQFNSTLSGKGIEFSATNGSTITNNMVDIANGQAAFITSGFDNLVENNTFRTNGSNSGSFSISRSVVNNNSFNATLVTVSVSGNDVNVSNNSVSQSANFGSALSVQGNNNVIRQNIVLTSAFTSTDAISVPSSANVTVINNTAGGAFAVLGIHLLNTVNSTVRDNFATAGAAGVSIDVDQSNAIVVYNNTMRGHALLLFNAREINVTGNTMPGMLMQRSNNSIIRDNLVSTAAFVTDALRVLISSNNNSFSNNTFISSAGIAIDFGSTVQNNSFDNNTLRANVTWIQSAAGALNSTFNNTVFATYNGSVLMSNWTLPADTLVNTQKLNISANNSFVNTTNLSFLNVSSQVSLAGLSFSDPRPVVDFNDDGVFADCDAPQCIEVSFAGGIYVFNVSSFTSYAAQENLTFTINVSIDKFDSPDPVARGSQLSYQIQINSTGNASALNVTLVETYPPNVSFVSSEPAPSSGNNTFSIGNLTNGSSFLVNITVNVSSSVSNGTLLNNSVQVIFTNSSGVNSTVNDSELTTVLGAPVLVSIKSDTPDPVVKGGMLNYTILINNTGDDTAFNITLSEVYPVGVSFVGASPTPIGNSTFSIGTLTPGDSFLVNITVTVGSNVANGTILNNSVNLSFRNATGGQSTASDSELTTVLGFSNVTVTKTDSPDPVNNGSTLSYTITITNSGDDTAFNVTAVEGYDANVTFNGSSPVPTIGNNTFNVGNLSPGQSTTINITVNVSASAVGVLNNTVNVSSENLSGNVSLATAFAETNVTVVGPAPAPAGGAGSGGGGGAAFTRNTPITRNETVVTPVPLTFPFAQFPAAKSEPPATNNEPQPVSSNLSPTNDEPQTPEPNLQPTSSDLQPLAGRSWSWPVLSLPEFKWSSLPKLPDFGLPGWYRTAVAGILGSFLVLLLLGVVSRSLARQAERRLVERRQFISTARPVWKKGAVAHMKGLFGGSEEKSLVPSVLSQRSSASVQNIDAELDALKADLKKLKYRVHHTARKGKNV